VVGDQRLAGPVMRRVGLGVGPAQYLNDILWSRFKTLVLVGFGVENNAGHGTTMRKKVFKHFTIKKIGL